MNKKVTGIIAYLTIVGWLIAFLVGDRNGAKFHLNQALVLALAEIVAGIIGGIPFIGWIVGGILGIFLFVCWILGIVGAITGKNKPVPILGGIKILN